MVVMPKTGAPPRPSSYLQPPAEPLGQNADLHAVAGEVVRDMIRRDPELWAAVQRDPEMRRAFGFDEQEFGRSAE